MMFERRTSKTAVGRIYICMHRALGSIRDVLHPSSGSSGGRTVCHTRRLCDEIRTKVAGLALSVLHPFS